MNNSLCPRSIGLLTLVAPIRSATVHYPEYALNNSAHTKWTWYEGNGGNVFEVRAADPAPVTDTRVYVLLETYQEGRYFKLSCDCLGAFAIAEIELEFAQSREFGYLLL